MKKFRNILTLTLGLIVVAGCNPDKLELVNPNEQTTDTFLRTEAQVQSAVNAIYSNMQTHGMFHRGWYFGLDNMGHDNDHDFNNQLEADKREYLLFTFGPNHRLTSQLWGSCYRGINKANFVIGSEEQINEIPNDLMPQQRKAKFIAEARFLRALYYFILVTRFGDVPMNVSIPQSAEGLPITDRNTIYTQVIIPDLEAATSDLLDAGNEESGRATSGAAWALLGKVHLYRGEYTDAMAAFNQIYGSYSLTDNYFDNFMEETEHNSESIFEVEYDDDLGTSNIWGTGESGQGLNEATFRGQEYGFNDWFNVYPSGELLDAYEPGDLRFEESFYEVGDTFAGGEAVVESIQYDRRAAWRKYQNYYKDMNEDTESGINFRLIRYADVLLMMAEAANELGNIGDAVDYLNEVRDRAQMPNYGTPAMDGIYPVGTKEQVFEAIVHERQVELAGEQHRFADLVRWGLADDYLGQYGFVAGKHEVYPIPQSEINNNPVLSNADQNPGYN